MFGDKQTGLSQPQFEIVQRLADLLDGIRGVRGLALGGSFARGRARADSDIDVGVYYSEAAPPDVHAIRRVANGINDAPNPIVTDVGAWGAWADGGAWLTIEGQRMDLIYRSVDRIERVHADATVGRFEIAYGQQPPFGFFGPTLLGECRIAVELRDPFGEIQRLKALASVYPPALRRAVVQQCLWDAEFNIRAFAPKFARSQNVAGTVGCLARAVHHMTLVLFALNRRFPLNDKTALAETRNFEVAPPRFADQVSRLLASPGATGEVLATSVQAMSNIVDEVRTLVGPIYKQAWPIEQL